MNTRFAIIAFVVVLALVGGMVVLTGGQSKTPAAAVSPTVSVVPTPALPTVAPTPTPTVAPTPTIASTATPVPTPATFTISGKVTDAATNQPVSGVTVFVYKPGTPASWAGGRVSCPESPVTVAQLQSKADGSYQTARLEPGTYFVRISLQSGSGYTGPTFWNGQNQCQSATEILLQHEMSDINFALKR